MKHKIYINHCVQVDHFARVKLASLDYNLDDDRPDCKGELYIAPIVEITDLRPAHWAGALCLYATTNADPILLGFLLNGGVEFVPSDLSKGMDDAMLDVLKRASWNHPANSDDSYSYVIEDAITDKQLDELSFFYALPALPKRN